MIAKKFKPKNSVFKNWNKDLYIAPKIGVTYDDYNNETIEYGTPFYFGRVNYQPMNWRDLRSYMSAYGETSKNIVGLLIDYNQLGMFKEFDLAYLYGATPEGESINGANANYIVKSYKEQNTKIMVMFEELIKDNSDPLDVSEENTKEEIIDGQG